jgi:hypothetical protein
VVDLLTLAAAADVISGTAVIVAVAIGVQQVQSYRSQRKRESALSLVQSFETPQFARGCFNLINIPDGLTRKELEEHLGDRIDDMWLLATTFESLGILVFHRELELDMVEDFFSGVILVAWRKLRTVAEEVRAEGRETYFEWFQWLVERIQEHEQSRPAVPAHIEHRGWKPRAL